MMEVMTGMDSDERLWEARLVADVRAGVRLAENELYAYCADYFGVNTAACSLWEKKRRQRYSKMLSSPCGSTSSGGAWYVLMETWWVKRRTPDLQHPHLFHG